MGLADRIIRTAASVVLIGLCANKKVSTPLRNELLMLSGVFLATSVLGSCPAYRA
ncbi:MAG: DUF2892 domain-containing protein [Ginsengibacter sp.]